MHVDKKTLVTVLLVAAILAASIVYLKHAGLIGRARPPDSVLQHPVEMIDRNTMELITETRGKWDDLGKDDRGFYKNPKTGKFTMVDPMTCASCEQKIPPPEHTQEQLKNWRAMQKLMADYKCPKCGKPACRIGMLGPPPTTTPPPSGPAAPPVAK